MCWSACAPGWTRRAKRCSRDIEWGSELTDGQQTRERLRAAGLSWRELPPLWDLDRPEDLAHLPAALAC